MTHTLYVRGIPDEVHARILENAAERSLPVAAYVRLLLINHARLMTFATPAESGSNAKSTIENGE